MAVVIGVERRGAVESSEGFSVRRGLVVTGRIDQNCHVESGLRG